jgi:hypothetical protein
MRGVVPSADDIRSHAKTFRFHQDSGMQMDMEVEEYTADWVPPQFSLKCAYILTEMSSAGHANTWVLPRGHRTDSWEAPPSGGAASVASLLAAILTEIYLCNVCSCHEILRRNGLGQWDSRPTPSQSAAPPTRASSLTVAASTAQHRTGATRHGKCGELSPAGWRSSTPVCSVRDSHLARNALHSFVGYGYRWLQPKDGMYVEPAMASSRCAVQRQMMGFTTSTISVTQ